MTDHQANTFLDVQKSLSRRQTRWAEFLSRFHIEWKYKPGAKNPADPLSRKPDLQSQCAGWHLLENEMLSPDSPSAAEGK